jgi:hypothetical protein
MKNRLFVALKLWFACSFVETYAICKWQPLYWLAFAVDLGEHHDNMSQRAATESWPITFVTNPHPAAVVRMQHTEGGEVAEMSRRRAFHLLHTQCHCVLALLSWLCFALSVLLFSSVPPFFYFFPYVTVFSFLSPPCPFPLLVYFLPFSCITFHLLYLSPIPSLSFIFTLSTICYHDHKFLLYLMYLPSADLFPFLFPLLLIYTVTYSSY